MNPKIKSKIMLISIRASSVNISSNYQNQDLEMEVKNQILLPGPTKNHKNHLIKKNLNKIS
jgi:hypothetical protein